MIIIEVLLDRDKTVSIQNFFTKSTAFFKRSSRLELLILGNFPSINIYSSFRFSISFSPIISTESIPLLAATIFSSEHLIK